MAVSQRAAERQAGFHQARGPVGAFFNTKQMSTSPVPLPLALRRWSNPRAIHLFHRSFLPLSITCKCRLSLKVGIWTAPVSVLRVLPSIGIHSKCYTSPDCIIQRISSQSLHMVQRSHSFKDNALAQKKKLPVSTQTLKYALQQALHTETRRAWSSLTP